MSIAVSTLVLRSRRLQWLLGAASISCVGLAVIIGLGLVGELQALSRGAIALAVLGIGLFALRECGRNIPEQQLDISGQGQIRLRSASIATRAGLLAVKPGDAVGLHRMLSGTTLLRSLLVLRLQNSRGQIITLMIFRDSVSPEAFRRIAIAARWIAHHQYRGHENFL